MKTFFFHLMPYPYLPEDFREHYPSASLILPNKLHDPELGRQLYHRYLDELEYAETIGLDGIALNEHHQSAYGSMPSPDLMAATLVRRTERVKIAILGNAIPLRDHPLRVAEEIAMLDVISGGRIISGFVRGIGHEYFMQNINPTYSHERFYEAHDLIVRAWTEDGPFRFEGKHFVQRYVNTWPRPYQKPHPPIWIPSMGSSETIEWAAAPERRYTYLQTYSPVTSVAKYFDKYRETARAHGYEATPDQLGLAIPIYVGETDEAARREAEPHLDFFFNKLLGNPFMFPPGYLTDRSMAGVFQAKQQLLGSTVTTFDDLKAGERIVVGSPETVRAKLESIWERLHMGYLIGTFQFGSLPHDLTMNSLRLFGEQVLPHVRSLGESAAQEQPA